MKNPTNIFIKNKSSSSSSSRKKEKKKLPGRPVSKRLDTALYTTSHQQSINNNCLEKSFVRCCCYIFELSSKVREVTTCTQQHYYYPTTNNNNNNNNIQQPDYYTQQLLPLFISHESQNLHSLRSQILLHSKPGLFDQSPLHMSLCRPIYTTDETARPSRVVRCGAIFVGRWCLPNFLKKNSEPY